MLSAYIRGSMNSIVILPGSKHGMEKPYVGTLMGQMFSTVWRIQARRGVSEHQPAELSPILTRKAHVCVTSLSSCKLDRGHTSSPQKSSQALSSANLIMIRDSNQQLLLCANYNIGGNNYK